MLVRVLKLSHVNIVPTRVETYQGEADFDMITARAVGRLDQLIAWTSPLLAAQGQWVLMKGKSPDVELAALTLPYTVHPYSVPGLEDERCVVCISK